MEDLLRQHGWPADRVAPTATAMIAGLEGALLLARVEGNAQPIHDMTQALCVILQAGGPESL